MLNKLIIDQMLKLLDKTECGGLTVELPDRRRYDFHGQKEGPNADITIHDWRVASALVTRGDVGFAQSYRDGWWDSNDVYSLMLFALKNESTTDSIIFGNPIVSFGSQMLYAFQRNSLKGSRKNIQAHYDLGNEFYELWLDPTMTYSSALYRSPEDKLEQAQLNKYDRIIDELNQGSGSILEIGCGWGGFSDRASSRGDYEIRGLTLSDEQHAYAQRRLQDRANIVLEDYRIQNSKVDHIVSIEMFEAVGEQYWRTYFQKLKETLNAKGSAVIQTITIGDAFFSRYRKTTDFVRSFVFPGGMLPSPNRFKEEAQNAGFKLVDSFSFGHHYAQTLLDWSKNFECKLPQVRALGFDEEFIRIWRFYLLGCAAGFSAERTDVMQVKLVHA